MSNLCCAIPCGSHRPAASRKGLTGMADEGRDTEVAATTERSVSAPRERDGPTGDEVTTPALQSENGPDNTSQPGPRDGGPDGSADADFERPRAPNTGPVTEDEVTEWIGTVGQSPEA